MLSLKDPLWNRYPWLLPALSDPDSTEAKWAKVLHAYIQCRLDLWTAGDFDFFGDWWAYYPGTSLISGETQPFTAFSYFFAS